MKRVIRGSVTSAKSTEYDPAYRNYIEEVAERIDAQEYDDIYEVCEYVANKFHKDINTVRDDINKIINASSVNATDEAAYAIQYFQVFSNPKKPTDKGKMIAQAGTFEEAHQKGKKLAGENNYFLKAVCNDGKVRYIDNDYSGPMIAGSSHVDNTRDLIRKAIKGDPSAIKLLKSQGYKVNKLVNPLHRNEVGTYAVTDTEGQVYTYDNTFMKDVASASYGGAFDIEDDQYFTKDEIVEFGNTVCEHLNETFYDTYDVSDVYMETPKKLVLTVVQKSDESEFTATIDIDMRKIRKPSDLMNRYVGDVVYALQQDIKAYNDEINASSDITSAQKTGVEWIKTKVWNAIVAKLEDDGWEPDDISDYVFVDVTQEDDRIRVEVRAELSYEGLEELIESIDPIVQEYDNSAYFEPVEPGIAEAYIYNLSNVNSSETVEAGIYDVPERPLDPPEDNSWEELDSDDEVIELTLDAIVHIDEDGSWEYDDTNYPWAASQDNNRGDWYTDEYNVYIGDKTSIVEYVDELLEPMMPAKAGEYHIKGDVTLVFSVEGIEVKRDYYWDDRHGADYDEEAYTDDAETSFLYDKSHIKNFEITER